MRRREDIEIAMEESMMEIMPQLEKRTGTSASAANVATLLGLLGTIVGLIQAFTAVSNANPAEKADLLSARIAVAMNTTAFGLLVAIPLLVVHSRADDEDRADRRRPRDGVGQDVERDQSTGSASSRSRPTQAAA